jgi:hypothetical protein
MSAVATPPRPTPPPSAPLITVEEFFRDYGDGGYEHVRGQVIEVPKTGAKQGKVCQKVT